MVQWMVTRGPEPSEVAECQNPRTLEHAYDAPHMPLAAVQPNLSELVAGMVPGEEVVLTAKGEPVAIVTRPALTSWPSQPGTAKDRSFWMAPDFDAPLEDFAEYME